MSFMTEACWTSPTTSHSTITQSRKMPASTLPGAVELSHEDDWTRVKDPKEKKRIQNRVAQRTYRHRMKARLGELQARLDSHEKRGSNSSAGTNASTPGSMTDSDSIAPPNCPLPTTFTTTSAPLPPSNRAMEESPSPMALAGDKPAGQLPLMQPNIYDQPVDDSDPSLFPHAAHMMHSPPHSLPSPQMQPNGLLSPPGQSGSENGGSKMSQDFMMDCLRFQTGLLNRLNDLQQDPAQQEPAYPTGPYGQPDNVANILDTMTQAEQVNALAAFTPANTDGLDLGFDAGCEPWKPDPFVTMQCQGTPPEKLEYAQMPGSEHLGPVMASPSTGMNPAHLSIQPPPQHPMDASHEDRFHNIMQSISHAGFESFDQMVAAYYSDTFADASSLANEQRLSRNRRLPKVISDISNAAMQWSNWEQRGYFEEILKTAESMVTLEGASARDNVMSKFGPLMEAQDGMNPMHKADALLAMKKAVQEELPNSWALTMALAADNKMSWQRDRSSTALATILLVSFSGRLPNDQLLRLVGTCL